MLSAADPIMKLPAGTTTISGHSGQSLKLSPEPGLMPSPELDGATGTRTPSHGSPPGAVGCGSSAHPALTNRSIATQTLSARTIPGCPCHVNVLRDIAVARPNVQTLQRSWFGPKQPTLWGSTCCPFTNGGMLLTVHLAHDRQRLRPEGDYAMDVRSKRLLACLIETENFNAILSEMAVITALKAEYFRDKSEAKQWAKVSDKLIKLRDWSQLYGPGSGCK
jgi:hypothetical protein